MDRPWAQVPGWVAGALRPELDGVTAAVISGGNLDVSKLML